MSIPEERRLVSVLFADLVGFTGRAESTDPEAVREMQRAYFEAVSAQVERYGGTVEKYIGDAVMALFGAPRAHDDDAERALRAALEIRHAVGELDAGLEVRIGVNSGEVVGGAGTGPHVGEYTVSGDAVNVAARLQQTAQPNEILAGGATRRLAAEAFAFVPLPEIAVKGRAGGVEAWRLDRQLPERPRLRGGEGRLVGRSRELAMVDSALEEAGARRGLMLAVAGEPGIGKTRLGLEARGRAEAAGFQTAWTISRPYSAAFPYHVLSQLTRQLLGRAAGAAAPDMLRERGLTSDETTLAAWAAALTEMLEESQADPQLAELSPAARQRLLVQAVDALLRAVCRQRPLLIVLDDLHWADPASLAVLEELLDGIGDLRTAILALYRSGWSHGWEGKSAYEQVNLRALRPEEARDLAGQIVGGSKVTGDVTERVLTRSGGNPFFLEELLRAAGQPETDPRRRLPETIHEILLARLDTLDPDVRQTLQLASVVGMEFSEAVVAVLSADVDEATTAEALRTLHHAELLVRRTDDDGERLLAFRHPLIHEVAYHSLLMGDRKRLHARIGHWLEAQAGLDLATPSQAGSAVLTDAVGMPSRRTDVAAPSSAPYRHLAALARHYRDSDDLAKAREFLPLAGEHAERLNAGQEAKGWYLDAAEAFTDEPARRAAMLEAAARQTYLVGVSSDANGLMEEAIALYDTAGEPIAALNARRLLGRYFWLQGNPGEAQRQFGLAIEGLEQLPPTPELAYAYSFRSQALMLVPDPEGGERWARKAIEVGEALNAIGPLVHAYNNLGLCLFHKGDPEGQAYLRRSLDMALEHGLADDAGRAYANLSGQGNRVFPFGYEAEQAFLEEALAYARRTIAGGTFEQWIRMASAEFMISVGHWPEAAAVLDEADWSRSEQYSQVEVASMRSQLASYQGRYEDAAALSTATIEGAVRVGDLQAIWPAFVALAHGQLGLGEDAEGIASLRRAIEEAGARVDGILGCWFVFEGADALAAAGRRDGQPADPASIASAAEMLLEFAARLAPQAAIAGDAFVVDASRALFGAGIEQLRVLGAAAGSAGALANVSGDPFPTRAQAVDALDTVHRVFDVARIRLWLAEEARDPGSLGDAATVFDALGAHLYLERSRRLEGRTQFPL